MSARKSVAEFNRRRTMAMGFLAAHMGEPFTTAQIALALGTSQARIQNTLSAMRREQEIKSRIGTLALDGHALAIWWAEPARVPSAAGPRNPFRPLRPVRCSVIPVRAGGRMAPVISDDPNVGMGHWTRNEFSPTEAFA